MVHVVVSGDAIQAVDSIVSKNGLETANPP